MNERPGDVAARRMRCTLRVHPTRSRARAFSVEIGQLTAEGSDEPFGAAVLPGRARAWWLLMRAVRHAARR
jgi:hypothetical protein